MVKGICLDRNRDKNNNIIAYMIKLENSKTIIMKSNQLKKCIREKKLNVENLTLTSDNRLVIHDIEEKTPQIMNKEEQTKEKILEFLQTSNTGYERDRNNYIMHKLNSKRVGKSILRALLIGMTCMTVAGPLTGCSVKGINTSQGVETNIENAKDLTIDEAKEYFKNAEAIGIDVSNFSLTTKAKIYVDGTEIAKLGGTFFKSTEEITLTNKNDEVIGSSKRQFTLLLDKWEIKDEHGNVKYTMKREVSLFRGYKILDSNGNEFGEIDKDNAIEGSAVLKNKDGEIIAKLTNDIFRKDYSIEIVEKEEINAEDAILIFSSYMSKLTTDKNTSKSGSRSGKSK